MNLQTVCFFQMLEEALNLLRSSGATSDWGTEVFGITKFLVESASFQNYIVPKSDHRLDKNLVQKWQRTVFLWLLMPSATHWVNQSGIVDHYSILPLCQVAPIQLSDGALWIRSVYWRFSFQFITFLNWILFTLDHDNFSHIFPDFSTKLLSS